MSESWYDTAQVCLSGHTVNSSSVRYPTSNANFCKECGARTITACEGCNESIRGYYNVPGVPGGIHYEPPSFCHNCGKPYPWTESSINAAKELTDELDELTSEDKELLKKSLDDIVRETPQTVLASTRFKRIAAKGSKEAAEGFKQILIGVVSETAKKIIWP